MEARARLEKSAWLKDSAIQARTAYRYHEAQSCGRRGSRARRSRCSSRNLASNDLGITFLTIKLSVVEALEAAFELGDSDRVDELLVMIESLRPGERPPLLDAHARRFRAKLSGDEAGFEAAADRFRKLEMPFWLAVTELEHAELLAEQGREAEAEPLLAEAREIFARLEAKPWLERATALRPERPARDPGLSGRLQPARPRCSEVAPVLRQHEAHAVVHRREGRLRLFARLLGADGQQPLQLAARPRAMRHSAAGSDRAARRPPRPRPP